MAPRSELPANLKRSANRKATPRKPPAPGSTLAELAAAGVLTKGNTKPGTRGRQAVDRQTYLNRTTRNLSLSPSQATGHRKPTDRPTVISVLVDEPPRQVVLEGLNRRDLSRAAKHANAVNQLESGRLAPEDFRRRFSRWRPIAGFRFLSNPDAVLAVMEGLRAQGQEPFILDSGLT